MVPPLPAENARGAPGHLQARRASIVLRRTLRRRGGRVLLTTRLLIEEPEGQHDQADDQADLDDEEKQREQKDGSEFPQTDADDADRGELQNGLEHDAIREMGISTIRDRRAKVTNRARSTPTRPGPTFMGCEATSTGSCCSL